MLRSGVSNLMRLDKLLLSSFKFILTHSWQTCLVSFPEWFITIRKEIYVTWDEPSTLFLVGGYSSLFYMPHCSANLDPTELWSDVIDSTVTLSLAADNIRRCLRWTTSLNTQTTKKGCLIDCVSGMTEEILYLISNYVTAVVAFWIFHTKAYC